VRGYILNADPNKHGEVSIEGAHPDGEAAISYADFIRGKHEVPLWLHRLNIEPIPGGLTFE